MHSQQHKISKKYLYMTLALAVIIAALWLFMISRGSTLTGGGTAGDETLQITANSPAAESTL